MEKNSPTCWHIANYCGAIILVIPTATNRNDILIAHRASSFLICNKKTIHLYNNRLWRMKTYIRTYCCVYVSKPAIQLKLFVAVPARQYNPWLHSPFASPVISIDALSHIHRPWPTTQTHPLAPGFGYVIGMSDEADSLNHIAQLSMRVHRLGDAIDVPQRQLALLLDSTVNDCHVAGN